MSKYLAPLLIGDTGISKQILLIERELVEHHKRFLPSTLPSTKFVWPIGCTILVLCCSTYRSFCCWYVPVEIRILFLTGCPSKPDTQRHLVDLRWRRIPTVNQEIILNIAHLQLQKTNLRNVSCNFSPSNTAVQVALETSCP